MLKEQIQKQIEQEAVHEASMHFHPQYSPDQNTACRINYKTGASRYAALWQAAEEKAARYEKALKEILNQAAYSPGNSWQDIAYQMKCIATEALIPKTGEDDR